MFFFYNVLIFCEMETLIKKEMLLPIQSRWSRKAVTFVPGGTVGAKIVLSRKVTQCMLWGEKCSSLWNDDAICQDKLPHI